MADRLEALREPERLAAIAASELLDSGAIPALDRVVRTAARLLETPVSQLNVVTGDGQIPVSHVGGAAWGRSVGLDRSFCRHVVHSGEPLVVANAHEHPLVSSSPVTLEGAIIAYLSVPIRSPRAQAPLATLCVVDFEPRDWTDRDIANLSDLAAWALCEIEQRTAQLRDRTPEQHGPSTETDGSRGVVVAIGTEAADELRARHETERARDRAERLQALTAALAKAATREEVADVVVADMVVALGARTGVLAGRAPDSDEMVLLRTIGFPEAVARTVRRQRLDMVSPLTECYRTQAPVWIERREGPAGLDARYPLIAPVWDALKVQSAAFVPLVAAGEAIGVISFAFDDRRRFVEEERAFLLALGQQAGLALERARLFDAEREARAEAERANRAKSEFLAIMSHELRTPLNAIGGYAEILEMGIRGPLTPEQTRDLSRIRESQRHLLGLINEVLNYARLETGSVHFNVTDVSMREVLAGAEALVAPQAQERSLTLDVAHLQQDLVVRGDAEKVQQILVNLLSNAVKFTEAGGRVELTCSAAGEFVKVSVRDTGLGIAEDQLERIFEPFVQVRADLTRTAEGTGLGLAISRDLARAMGGDLFARSEPGVGSTFTLRLPAAQAVGGSG